MNTHLETYLVPIEDELRELSREIEEKAWAGGCVRQLEVRHKAMLNRWLAGEEYHVKF